MNAAAEQRQRVAVAGDYPAAAALRRRRAQMEASGQVFPPPPATAPAASAAGAARADERAQQVPHRRRNNNNRTNRSSNRNNSSNLRTSHVYCLVSLAVAVLAIVTSTAPPLHVLPLVGVGGGVGEGVTSMGVGDSGKNSQVSAAAKGSGEGRGNIDTSSSNTGGNSKNFNPPASYSDLFRPFTDFFTRGDGGNDIVNGGNGVGGGGGIGASLLGDLEGMLGLSGGGRNGKGLVDDAGDQKDASATTATTGQDDNGDDAPSASFFFLPQKLLPPGLKWLVGPNIPSSHRGDDRDSRNSNNNKADHGKKDVGKSKQHGRGNIGKDKAKIKNKHSDATCSGNGSGDGGGTCQTKQQDTKRNARRREKLTPRRIFHTFLRTLGAMIDPSIRSLPAEPAGSFTKVVDKVLTSTPRLLAIANLLLAATYLLHGAVAEFFLGQGGGSRNRGGAGQGQGTTIPQTNARNRQQGQAPPAVGAAQAPTAPTGAGVPPMPPTRLNRSNRERLGGYLLFKLLLVSAVVEPDTLDLLILLSWYTLLSFLRSLAHLAGTATSHAAQSGSPPVPGVLRLLVVVLLSDFCAAALCAGLFSGAGWGTVLLLSCDCALLAVDTLAHIARHVGQMFEEKHSAEVGALEEEQLRLGDEARNSSSTASDGQDDLDDNVTSTETNTGDDTHVVGSTHIVDEPTHPRDRAHQQSRLIDRQIELLESLHCRRLSILDSVVFSLELAAYLLTICHFLHIWSLHGVSFGLIDSVLALHLHSAVSAMGRKIGERRNLNRIAQSLDSHFSDATELELRKSLAAGDVCSVCLGTMSGLRNVKKVGCGHLYHTHCLREVVERARSIEAAKCPLCRACILDGSQPGQRNAPVTGDGAEANQGEQNDAQQQQDTDGAPNQQARQQQDARDQALFSFSTENILPNWIPIPALSFEIVRRPPANGGLGNQRAVATSAGGAGDVNPPERPNQQRQQQGETSFWRRLLILSGVVPMNPEEEAAALESLTDMFPQYERSDLLRELRLRGSAEGVVEAVLAGVFTGVPRGGGAVQLVDQPGGAANLFEQDDNSIIADADHETTNDADGIGGGDERERQ